MKTQQLPNQYPKLWAVIPAAGSGSRFSKTALKQYQKIDQYTVLEHTVQVLSHLPLAGCVLAISSEDTYANTLKFPNHLPIHFCHGGQERVYSVLNALKYLQQFAAIDDWVLVHDAARPCVGVIELEQLQQHCLVHQRAAILATPVRDTLKSVIQHPEIEKTVDRRYLWQAQTPQMVQLGVLINAISTALADEIVITDEASALEHVDVPVDVVMGRADNIKITYPEDLELARLILQSRA